jgi:hypothetical protein
LWARQLAWLQSSDDEKNASRWVQLERAPHILPEQGDLQDANLLLARVGLYSQSGMGGIAPIQAGQIAEFVAATCGLISPYEVDAALLASDAYVGEYHRSNNRSTDAPWDWPKSKRDLEIFEAQTAKAMKVITGE